MSAHRYLAAALVVAAVSHSAMAQVATARSHLASVPDVELREELVDRIVMRWASYVEDMHMTNAEEWVRSMAPTFKRASIQALRKAATSTRFKAMNDALLTGDSGRETLSRQVAEVRKSGLLSTKALGDADRDLVFVPITPCRIVDTRIAGGAIPAGTVRGFDVTLISSYASQGGSATDCNGAGSAGNFAAGVFNFTVVTPEAAGYITAFPIGVTRPLASTVNYVAGDIVANLGIVRLDQGPSENELAVFTFAQTHLVVDLVGYFRNVASVAPLDCVTTISTSNAVAASATANVTAPLCAAGYAETATYCESQSWDMPIVYSSNGVCSAQNNGSVIANLLAKRRCCRSPVLN